MTFLDPIVSWCHPKVKRVEKVETFPLATLIWTFLGAFGCQYGWCVSLSEIWSEESTYTKPPFYCAYYLSIPLFLSFILTVKSDTSYPLSFGINLWAIFLSLWTPVRIFTVRGHDKTLDIHSTAAVRGFSLVISPLPAPYNKTSRYQSSERLEEGKTSWKNSVKLVKTWHRCCHLP